MTLQNAYTTLALAKAELNITTSDYDTKLEAAISAASRQVDGYCGRFFYQDSSVATRTFYADCTDECEVDDISTTTGLIVKVDTNADGTYATTLTISTNFILLPSNADKQYPVWPWTCIRLVDYGVSSFPVSSPRPGVQVTAKFGWPAIPDDVAKATLIQAVQLFKSSDAVFGGLNFDAGILRVRDTINPMAAALLERYVKVYA